MKREDLQKIEGLTKEQIDSIMNLHQSDATDWNTRLGNLQKEVSDRDTTITNLTEQVKGYDGVDVKKLQQDVTDWETKYNNDLATERKNSAIKLAIAKAKPRNEKAVMALIDTDIIKVDKDGNVTGLKEQLDTIQKDNDFLFEKEEIKPQDVNLNLDHNGQPSDKPLTLNDAITEHYEQGGE